MNPTAKQDAQALSGLKNIGQQVPHHGCVVLLQNRKPTGNLRKYVLHAYHASIIKVNMI